MKKRSKGNKRARKQKTVANTQDASSATNNGAGQRAVDFIGNLCNTKGEWAGKPFHLLEWEEKIIRDLFGTLNPDGTRQYREAYISTARKNGKTEIAGAIGNYCLYADGEKTPEVYTNAGDRDQASLVFNAAASMIEMSGALSKRSKILHSTKRIVNHENSGFLRALSHEAYTKHGYNVSTAINDEIHVWPNRELYDVMKTGTGARRQPLTINITTAGWDKESFCHDLYDYAKKVKTGVIDDPTFYVAIFELDEGDAWKDEKNWHKANPSLGHTITIDFLRNEFKRAMENPSFENTFRRLYLNQWTSQETKMIPVEKWDACNKLLDPETLKGRLCYGGLDLATTTDIAAFVLCFSPETDEGFAFLPFFFVPEEAIEKRAKKDRVPYDVWVRQGHITATPGNVIDYNFIKAKMRETAETYNLKDVAYDRWGATALVTDMTDEGLEMVPMGMGFASMSSPTKEFLKLILSEKIRHDDNPVMRWMIDNCAVKTDPAGNLKPDKEKSSEKIDGVVASIMALDRAIRNAKGLSIYDSQDVKRVFDGEEMPIPEPKEEFEETYEQEEATVRRCQRCGIVVAEMEYCTNCGARILIG